MAYGDDPDPRPMHSLRFLLGVAFAWGALVGAVVVTIAREL